MISLRRGYVEKIIHQTIDKSEVIVEINGAMEKAINYNHLSGEIAVGDLVIMNTTAVELGLGTGGYHFIIANLRHESIRSSGKGHIMKLRYTPFQIKVLAAEEQNSPYHELFLNFETLDGLPVLIGTLHSMVLPMAATIKYYRPKAKIAYIMTDGAALPIYLSKTVDLLKEKKLIDATITIGNAFGGDFECINVYNGLIAAKEIIKCDFAIITMGPGIVGSGTPFGFSGIEQGVNIDAVNSLGGKAITIPRISFADKRERHKGISHHTLTVLNKIAKTKSHLPLPLLEKTKMDYLHNQINNLKIDKKHYIVEVNASILPTILDKYSISVNSMGREFHDDPAFFLACCSGARYSLEALK